jgi:hypothetical protein
MLGLNHRRWVGCIHGLVASNVDLGVAIVGIFAKLPFELALRRC